MIKLGIIINNFEKIFGRQYKQDKFYSMNNENEQKKSIWEVGLVDPIKINIDAIKEKLIIFINNITYQSYEEVLKTCNFSKGIRVEFVEEIEQIFFVLSNIYDLFPNYLEKYFKGDWLNLHLKLIDKCLDINSPPNPRLGYRNDAKIDILSKFLLFFTLCMSKDIDFRHRLFLALKYPDLLYKIVVISANANYSCCCGHGMNCTKTDIGTSIKSALLVFETLKYLEYIDYDGANQTKKNILEFLFRNIGKNISIVYLNKMASMLNNEWIFNHLLNETNLFDEALNKENDFSFNHAIDNFRNFVSLCKNPELAFSILNRASPPNTVVKRIVYQEVLTTVSEIINSNNQKEYLEKLYSGPLFQKTIDILKEDIYLSYYEKIFEILIDSTKDNIVAIIDKNKNKFNISEIINNQIDFLISKKLTGFRLNAVIKITNLFLKIGSEIDKKNKCGNYYVEQFKDIYKKVNSLHLQYFDYSINGEALKEFYKYFA